MKKFKIKDSGKRQTFATGAKRDTAENKSRPDLISPFAMWRLGEHLRKGDAKYGQDLHIPIPRDLLFNRICDIIGICKKNKLNVDIKIELFTAIKNVGLVTKNTYEKLTQILLKGKKLIEGSGENKRKILKKSKFSTRKEELTPILLNGINEPSIYGHLKLEDWMKKKVYYLNQDKTINAESVNEVLGKLPNILTMIIKQGSQEDIYVVGATTDLECLEILLKELKGLYNTCKILPLIRFSNKNNVLCEFIDNSRNWEKGMPFSRFLASAHRHLLQFEKGEVDEDHLSAILFNIHAIIHFQEIGRKDLDDLSFR